MTYKSLKNPTFSVKDVLVDDPLDNFPVIICCNSGIEWEHKAAHHECCIKRAEGLLLYVPCFDPPESMCAYMKHGDDEFDVSQEERKKIADDINREICDIRTKVIWGIHFDYSRINQMVEGWIPVEVILSNFDKNNLIDMIIAREGYLCIENCD